MKIHGLVVGLLIAGSLADAATACDYTLMSTRVLQCRPIELLEGPSGQPAWTFVNEAASGANVLAHVLCACTADLKAAETNCTPHKTQKITITKESSDILKTCGEPDLCKDSCQAFFNQKS